MCPWTAGASRENDAGSHREPRSARASRAVIIGVAPEAAVVGPAVLGVEDSRRELAPGMLFRDGLDRVSLIDREEGISLSMKVLTLLGHLRAVLDLLGWIASMPIRLRVHILASHPICDRLTSGIGRLLLLAVPAAS